jgi:L-fuconolactonase
MPSFPIVDTHLHLWDVQRLNYPWLANSRVLNRNFLVEDFRIACGPVEVGKMVFVQCDCAPEQAAAEAKWVARVARQDARER